MPTTRELKLILLLLVIKDRFKKIKTTIDAFANYIGQTEFQMMSCMLKLNATVWQQKLNTEVIGG